MLGSGTAVTPMVTQFMASAYRTVRGPQNALKVEHGSSRACCGAWSAAPTLHTDELARTTAGHHGPSFGLARDIDWNEKGVGNRRERQVHEMEQS